MPYQHFAVPASGGEIQEQLNRFLASHQVLRVDKQFVANGAKNTICSWTGRYPTTQQPAR